MPPKKKKRKTTSTSTSTSTSTPTPESAIETAVESADERTLEEMSGVLLKLAMNDAVRTYRYGTPADRTALTKTFVTALAKRETAGSSKIDDEQADIRNKIQEMMGVGADLPDE